MEGTDLGRDIHSRSVGCGIRNQDGVVGTAAARSFSGCFTGIAVSRVAGVGYGRDP
jgi:hypothetical protein